MTMDDDEITTFTDGGDDIEPAAGPSSRSPLDALRAETKKEVRLPLLDLNVPVRPGWGMRFDPNEVDGDKMDHWAKKSVRGNNRKARRAGQVDLSDADQLKFARMVLQASHRAFLWQEHEGAEWQVVTDDVNGTPLSLGSEQFLEMVEAADVGSALRIWYGSDGHLLQVAEEIVDAAGFVEGDVNPLKAQ